MISIYQKEALKELDKQHQERIHKYSEIERKNAIKTLSGCMSDMKNVDFDELKLKELLK